MCARVVCAMQNRKQRPSQSSPSFVDPLFLKHFMTVKRKQYCIESLRKQITILQGIKEKKNRDEAKSI